MMPGHLTAMEELDRAFLNIRHRLLDVAAALDRIERAAGADELRSNRRLENLRSAARVLADDEPERARRVQMVFSDPYDDAWRRDA